MTLRQRLAQPMDPSSLAVFRIGIGLSLSLMLWQFITKDAGGSSLLERYITGADTAWWFSYPAFAWVKPMREPAMSQFLWIGIVAGYVLAMGMFTRLAATVVSAIFIYLWLSEPTLYGNNFPLATILVVPLTFIPSNRWLSADRWIAKAGRRPLLTTVPLWTIFLLRFHTGLVYFFGGVSKFHPDWLAGEPMRAWFNDGATADLVRTTLGPALADSLVVPLMKLDATVYAFQYLGLAFDLLIPFLLVIRRTRYLAFALATMFHLFNFFFVDKVGVVAFHAFWATLLFLEPDWPKRVIAWIKVPSYTPPDLGWFTFGMFAVPIVGALLGWKARRPPCPDSTVPASWFVTTFVTAYALLALSIPLRHFPIPGDAYWTEEGVAFSWFLMTRNKISEYTQFRVVAGLPAEERPRFTLQDVPLDRTASWVEAQKGVFLTWEPVLGFRAFARAADDADRNRLLADWNSTYGHEPSLKPTRSATEICQDISRRASQLASQDPSANEIMREMEEMMDELDSVTSAHDKALVLMRLDGRLRRVINFAPTHSTLIAPLLESTPFSFQGARPTLDLLLIADLSLIRTESALVVWQVDWDRWKEAREVAVNLDYLPRYYQRLLPLWIPARDATGETFTLWNYWQELNGHQIKAMGLFPFLTRQYAEHVAEEWEKKFGRRPAVRVHNLARLNEHDFAPLIDPKVDLASERYSLLQHNEWITSE